MKKNVNSLVRKCVACISSLVIASLAVSGSAYAATTDDVHTESVQTDADMTSMETVEKLEAIKDSLVGSPASVNATSMYLGHVQFTGENYGAWRTVGGGTATHVRMCIAFKPTSSGPSVEMPVILQQYPHVDRGQLYCTTYTTSPDADGYYFFVSNYFTISQYSDCRLHYNAMNSNTIYEPRTVDVHAWFDYY